MLINFWQLKKIFWHRNQTRDKGFYINGYSSNHYPDFILYTKKGNVILVETKGDDRDNDDSKDKNKLGTTWADKAGGKFKYFMVFQTKQVEGCYTTSTICDVLRLL